MEPEITPTPVASTRPPVGSSLAIPISIVVGFGMIAAALYFSNIHSAKLAETNNNPTPTETEKKAIAPVTEQDHIRGNPNAPIVFVEYSDYDCPFCKKFHEETMQKLMSDYGNSGKVAWVYRHFPLEQLHPNAPKLAQAAECVAELGGNDAFWKFSDAIFASREINAQTNITKLPELATAAGVDATAFNTCVSEGRHQDVVDADFADGAAAGVQGTPHTFVLVGDQQTEISGAQPYSVVKQFVDSVIAQMDAKQ